ncbi:MAG: ATP-dependent Clp protease ATP-binding subunit ClpA [Moraxella sp.]|nr:ATP-dependent Clp protease ATP-binding subunit ClpA [Moraxella sp.]
MLSPQLEHTQQLIYQFAQKEHHEYVLTEHLLWGLLANNSAKALLDSLKVDTALIVEALLAYFKDYVPKSNAKPIYSASYERCIRRAIFHVQASGQNRPVEGVDVLVALLSEKDSYAMQLLQAQGVSRLQLLRQLAHGEKGSDDITIVSLEAATAKKPTNPLTTFAHNLNERAKQGLTDPLIGRHTEVERCLEILARRRKNNPLLVGDPGVGKTAIAEGLAWLIVHNKVNPALKDATIYSLDLGALVAGTKYRGDFEARMKALLDAIKKEPHAILFIDEIHTVIGAGSSMNNSMDMSNLIKPALANGELRCIGSTTFTEYRQVFEKDSALSRRFQKVDITEPSLEDAIEILKGLRPQYEKFHHVRYSDEALAAAVTLSAKYIHERFLPDKAIDVMDEVGARQKLNDTKKETPIDIDVPMVEAVVARIARIPPKSVSKDDKAVLAHLAEDLKRVVFGQDDAIMRLTDAIMLSRAGLKAEEKPVGAFLFAGPTGVGKTEIARQLAFALGVPLVRFDMSEYMEAHTASRLIGAPPGYVGFDQGGLLTEKIGQTPHCVLLLDELEKAHPDVFNLLLQVMDNGTLTDNNGRTASFRQVILIMTTNVGADSISRNSMGFTEQDHSYDNTNAIKRTFTPEFRNRLDAIVHFAPLDTTIIASVVDKLLTQLQAQLDDKHVILTATDEARHYLARKGYDKLMGARPMARLIDDEIKKPLAHALLFGELVNGGSLTIDVNAEANALVFEIVAQEAPA